MLVSPIILVRLLTVDEFGTYRQFLLYAGMLSSIAAFNINNSLLYFVPAHPESTWRFVRQSVALVAINSTTVVILLALANFATGGAIVIEHYMLPLAAYTLFSVNLDFWEQLWLAQKKPGAVLGYSLGRLIARIVVVVVMAALSAPVDTIIWSLVILEGARLTFSAIFWRSIARGGRANAPIEASWQRQIQSALPLGVSLILLTVTRDAGGLVVGQVMGPVALAHYTIGTYAAPIILAVRNAVSDALLPEMAERQARSKDEALHLWQQATVVFAVLLFPAAAVLAYFADQIIVAVFSEEYRPAVPLFRIYLLLLLRECVDFGVVIRALDRNRLLVSANTIALILNLVLLSVLTPLLGSAGVVLALVGARFADGIYFAVRLSRDWGVPLRRLIPWGGLLRVAGVTLLAGLTLTIWEWKILGAAAGTPLGIAIALVVFAVTFTAGVHYAKVAEVELLTRRVHALVSSFRRKLA